MRAPEGLHVPQDHRGVPRPAAVRASSGNGARSRQPSIVPDLKSLAELGDVAFERVKELVSRLVKHSRAVVAVEDVPPSASRMSRSSNPNLREGLESSRIRPANDRETSRNDGNGRSVESAGQEPDSAIAAGSEIGSENTLKVETRVRTPLGQEEAQFRGRLSPPETPRAESMGRPDHACPARMSLASSSSSRARVRRSSPSRSSRRSRCSSR
jgi:hypothetical protein